MEKINLLSIIVPAYRQEKTIEKDIEQLERSLKVLPVNYEIIIVVDGFLDKTLERAKKHKSSKIHVLGYQENYGKGYAIRYGAEKARGDLIAFIDAGMDLDPTGISMLYNHMLWYDADIIVGSKLHPVSQVDYPPLRKILSWGYRTITHLMFGFKVRDTQVGLKIFRKKVVQDVFPQLLVKQYALDVEILAVAYFFGYTRIYEAPIKLNFREVGSISLYNFWRIALHMLWDTLAVYYRLNILHYYKKQK